MKRPFFCFHSQKVKNNYLCNTDIPEIDEA